MTQIKEFYNCLLRVIDEMSHFAPLSHFTPGYSIITPKKNYFNIQNGMACNSYVFNNDSVYVLHAVYKSLSCTQHCSLIQSYIGEVNIQWHGIFILFKYY